MRIRRFVFLMLILPFMALPGNVGAESIVPKERPRVYRGPVKESVMYSGYQYGYYPFYSPLLFMGPTIPGRSTLSVAVGSNGYRGTGFSTSERLKGTDLVFSLAASWEQGEWFYSDLDYELSTVSPGLSWSNGTTSVFLGLEISEFSLTSNQQPRVRPRIDSGPYKSAVHMNRSQQLDFERSDLHLGVTLPILENTQLFFSAGDHRFDQGVSAGIVDPLYDLDLFLERQRY